MLIKPSASIRQNYNEIADLCKTSGEPVYLTKNGEGDLVVMDIEAFSRREKKLKLREELLAVQEDRMAGRAGVTPDELDHYLESIIEQIDCSDGDSSFPNRLKFKKTTGPSSAKY
ncbi:type II toxin-antitoxin system Phd/YefM family antitoxin [Paenibacillus sp. GCM10027626]|uniref:type II toxin-antitoxin system Phd/YefM family antitoxin n=1 Tax=Paenibacillus sp. GCM10027626 TaxID=3273411 RepID=UPI00362C6F7C